MTRSSSKRTTLMNYIKDRALKAKTVVTDHPKLCASFGIVTTLMLLAMYGNTQHAKTVTAFLVEKGIDPQEFFLGPEDFETI